MSTGPYLDIGEAPAPGPWRTLPAPTNVPIAVGVVLAPSAATGAPGGAVVGAAEAAAARTAGAGIRAVAAVATAVQTAVAVTAAVLTGKPRADNRVADDSNLPIVVPAPAGHSDADYLEVPTPQITLAPAPTAAERPVTTPLSAPASPEPETVVIITTARPQTVAALPGVETAAPPELVRVVPIETPPPTVPAIEVITEEQPAPARTTLPGVATSTPRVVTVAPEPTNQTGPTTNPTPEARPEPTESDPNHRRWRWPTVPAIPWWLLALLATLLLWLLDQAGNGDRREPHVGQ